MRKMSIRIFNNATPLLLLLGCVIAFIGDGQTKSIFAVGRRILDDELLVKDILEAKSLGASESPEVAFQYDVPQPITYMEILSNADVHAELNFSYQNDIVSGKVKKSPTTENSIQNFDVQIFIYGFNETILNVSPEYLLNRNTQYNGVLIPIESIGNEDNYINGDEQYETIRKFDDIYINNNNSQINHEYFEENDYEDKGQEMSKNDDDDNAENNSVNDSEDKIIVVGQRQHGDQLLYETFQTTTEASSEPTDHTVVFYYIDSNYITNVQFIIYGHYSEKSIISEDYKPPVAEYTHFSPTSLKATITDFNTTSLFVHMFVFGYRPADIVNKVNYVPPLNSILNEQHQENFDGDTSDRLSPLERLKLIMKPQQADTNTETASNRAFVSHDDNGMSEKTTANNEVSITSSECFQQGGITSAATSSISIHLQCIQANAVIYLLFMFFIIFGQVLAVQYV